MLKPMASNVVGIGPTWLDRRQIGLKNPLGTRNHIYEQMYSNILPYGSWEHTFNNTYTSVHGGVFCLEFSPEGSLLVAACEKRSVLLFDPLTHKRINSVENAHLDCVNCVRFLDSRSFATCSDDFTVALWDARNLSQKVRTLKGHSNWVKNIEYSPRDGLLVTSGFDGSVLTWEMNTYREDGIVYKKVFSTNGLMRTRLTPDASKMIICTTGGYLIIVHNLDLNTMSQDLDGFKPNMYRLMQLSQTILPIASDFTHLFKGHGKRNRVEFVTDFPDGDDAEVVSSLQIHPDGHSVISRNVSNNEKSEWSCIHNIEETCSDESDYTDDDCDENDSCKMMSWPETSASISTTPSYIIQHTVVQNERSSSSRGNESDSVQHRDLSVSPSDVWEALVAIQEARIRRETDRVTSEISVGQMFRRQAMDSGVQSRSVNLDSQIFVTRILPNLGTSRDNEERINELRSSATVLRRNMSVNTTEIVAGNVSQRFSPASRNFGLTSRKKLPVRQRYASLYRRSLVGQYDRTSILRKPIYNHGIIEFKFKKLKRSFKLNTNYEMNETKRIRDNFINRHSISTADSRSSRDNSQDQASGSAISQPARGNRDTAKSDNPQLQRPESSASSLQRTLSTINSSLDSLRQGLSVIECNLNSFCQSINNLEGTINSTCEALTRGECTLRGTGDEGERQVEGAVPGHPTGGADGRSDPPRPDDDDRPESTADGAVDHEEVIEVQAGGGPDTTTTTNGESSHSNSLPVSASNPTAPRPDISQQPTSERTILMGVFRAGNEGGTRGTSMRKHNVAAVTVSSPPQASNEGSSSAGASGADTARGDRGCALNSLRSKKYSEVSGPATRHNSNAGCGNNSRNCSGSNSKRAAQTDAYSLPRKQNVSINKKIHQNTKRLTHYVEEPNLGRGFIKELCISPDGRIICSPFGNGIRLLSFSPTVQDVFHCYPPSPPIPLHELTLNIAHTDIVVSTKFSPYHNLLVSGCLSGKIVYYQPFL